MKAFYCVGTHWDREWYEPFQEYRMWLVELIDEAMDLMETEPEFRCFHLDGQAVVLEDYLDIRPEQRQRFLEHLQSSRFQAGPWYNLPDEWLVSGESLVRNLARGRRVCRELGFEPMDFGYTPDQFGHIAALPMLMHGFGIAAGICWRGTQDEHFPAQFTWVGPDGSRVPYQKLMDKGSYSAYDFFVRRPIEKDGISEGACREHFGKYWQEEIERAPLPLVLMIDAIDHQRPKREMLDVFNAVRDTHPEVEFIWGSFADYGHAVAARAGELPEYRGELREPLRTGDRLPQYLIVHTISSRYDLKKRNDACQALLELWGEPYALFQQMAGGAPVVRYLDKAWQYLLKNHPHDSICGCSIDQVHRDMHYRFDQSELLADGLVRRSMAALASSSAEEAAWKNLVVHNPLPFARNVVAELEVPMPPDYAKETGKSYLDGLATGEHINKFRLVTNDGRDVPFQHVRIDRGVTHHMRNALGRGVIRTADVYTVAAEVDVPACGWTTLRVESTDAATRAVTSLRTGPLCAGNAHLTLEVRPDGRARVGRTDGAGQYEGLFLYEDCGDGGDGWTLGRLVDDTVYCTPGSEVTTAIDEEGPLRVTFRIERRLRLPERMERGRWRRSAARTVLEVTDFLTVERDAPFVRVRTHVNNTVCDHRLRVLFPTGQAAARSFAETPFALVERETAVPPETAGWHERINPEKAFTGYFGVQHAEGGLAVICPAGLHEYEATPQGVLALTLYRSFFQTVMTNGETHGELLGPLEFEYLLYPFAGEFDAVEAARRLAEARAGLRAHWADADAEAPERSFLALEQNVCVLTALKPADDGEGGVLRLWNPTREAVCEEVRFGVPVKSVRRCNLEERALEDLEVSGDVVRVEVGAGALCNLRFAW